MKRHTLTIALLLLAAGAAAQQSRLARDLQRLIGAAPSMFEPLRGRAMGTGLGTAYASDIVIEGMQGGQFEIMTDDDVGYYNSTRMDEAPRAEALYDDLARRVPAALPTGWAECHPNAPLNRRAVDVRRRAFVNSSSAPTMAITLTLSARSERRMVTLTLMSFPRHPDVSPCHASH